MNKLPKILVIGCSGLLGGKIFSQLNGKAETLGTYNNEVPEGNCVKMDITNKEGVERTTHLFKPDIIIHTAALTNVDYCEDHTEEAYRVNVEGTKNIVDAAKSVGSKIVYISTDYVFDGEKGPYSEEDQPNPIGVYAKTKFEGEILVKNSPIPHLIIRTTVVYGFERNKQNFAMWLIKKLKKKEKVNIVNDQYGSPTFADDAARMIIDLLQNGASGIYNIAGPEIMDRYEFSLRVADHFDLDKGLINPVQTNELNQKAPRPMSAGLTVNKIRKLGIAPMPVGKSLEILRKQVDGIL